MFNYTKSTSENLLLQLLFYQQTPLFKLNSLGNVSYLYSTKTYPLYTNQTSLLDLNTTFSSTYLQKNATFIFNNEKVDNIKILNMYGISKFLSKSPTQPIYE